MTDAPIRDPKTGRLYPGVVLNPNGRPPRPDRFTRRCIMDICEKHGYNPIEEMIRIANDPAATPYIKLEVAKEVCSYLAPKVKQVQITNAEGDGDGQIKISWDVAPQTIEKAQKNDDLLAQQFKAKMENATQTILDGVAEAVIEDDDEQC